MENNNSEQCLLLVLQDNAFNYDKGVLAEILEPIMGKGLIPADLETWKPRRRAIVPAFHKAYLQAMIGMFGRCTEVAVQKLDATASSGQVHPLLNVTDQAWACQHIELQLQCRSWALLHYLGDCFHIQIDQTKSDKARA